MSLRNGIQEFGLANHIYKGATVTFYTVSGGVKTATKATLYADLTTSATLPNPQHLGATGKFVQPVYVEVEVIATISGLTIPDHDTGVIQSVLGSGSIDLPAVIHAATPITPLLDTDEFPLWRTLLGKVAWADFKAGILALFSVSAGSSLVGFLQAGTGAVPTTVQTKLRETVDVTIKSALKALPAPGITTFATVQGGTVAGDGFGGLYYWDGSSTLADNGDTVLIPTSAPANGRWEKIMMDDKSGWVSYGISSPNSYYSNPYSGITWPRSMVFIGDSITYGYPNATLTHQQSPIGVLQTMLSNDTGWEQGNWPCGGVWDRWTLAGGITYGTNGPAGKSLIMGIGATATITGNYVDSVNLFFQRAGGAGSIEIRVNGTLVGTVSTAGAAANDFLTVTNLTNRVGTGATVLLTCITAPVELTSVEICRTVAGNVPRIISHAVPGYGTTQYYNKAASIHACNSFVVQPQLVVIALGANDAYNSSPTYRNTSSQYEVNLQTLVSELIALGDACVLCVPLRPFSPAALWSGTETFENYRNAVYRVAKANGCPVIDQSELFFATSGVISFYQADGVHPTVHGATALAAFWHERIGLGSLSTKNVKITQAITLGAGMTAAGAPYSTPSFTVERDGMVRLSGTMTNAGGVIAFGQIIGTLTNGVTFDYPNTGRVVTQKNIVVCGFIAGGTGTPIRVAILTNGNISNLDALPLNTLLSFDGVTVSTLD